MPMTGLSLQDRSPGAGRAKLRPSRGFSAVVRRPIISRLAQPVLLRVFSIRRSINTNQTEFVNSGIHSRFTDSTEVGRLLMSQTFDYSRDIGRIWRP
jgi:hypothetical protein